MPLARNLVRQAAVFDKRLFFFTGILALLICDSAGRLAS
jgi:hypothetical protein